MLSIPEKIEKIKARLRQMEINNIEGCTEEEIEQLRQSQNVEHLPEMYRQLMLLMGRVGIGWTLGSRADYGMLRGTEKESLISELTANNILFPEEIYVCLEHQGYRYYFFEAKEGLDDPPVWGYWDYPHFYRLGDTLSEYILEKLKHIEENFVRLRGRPQHSVVYYYDPEKQEFYVFIHLVPWHNMSQKARIKKHKVRVA